ncbi:MAG: hypothetical protein JSU82_02805 [Rhodospirillales bacterium]|nr:MAG: hypothetical protein JSU82_02805 [Rhodospirillales bacterium]
MVDLPLTIAVSDYDHVRDFATGRVRAEGIDANVLTLSIEQIFSRFVKFREWHVSEISAAKYVALRSRGDDSLSAIPVFPSRAFRHSCIYVRGDSKIKAPADLAGGRVGYPEWAQTAGIYARALLTHEYGIPLSAIDWVQAGVAEPGRREKVALDLPEGVRVTPTPDRSLDEMLLSGDLDAVITSHPLPSFLADDGRVVRLFADYRDVEQEYWQRTGIFPIMHFVVIRQDVLQTNPWVAVNLQQAFEEAKRRSVARMRDPQASRFPMAWTTHCAEMAIHLFGTDPFPYGVESNRVTLESFLRYAGEQGLCKQPVTVEELFEKTVLDQVRV